MASTVMLLHLIVLMLLKVQGRVGQADYSRKDGGWNMCNTDTAARWGKVQQQKNRLRLLHWHTQTHSHSFSHGCACAKLLNGSMMRVNWLIWVEGGRKDIMVSIWLLHKRWQTSHSLSFLLLLKHSPYCLHHSNREQRSGMCSSAVCCALCVCVCVWFAVGCTSGVVVHSSLHLSSILGQRFWASAALLSRSVFWISVVWCVRLQKLDPVAASAFLRPAVPALGKKKKEWQGSRAQGGACPLHQISEWRTACLFLCNRLLSLWFWPTDLFRFTAASSWSWTDISGLSCY